MGDPQNEESSRVIAAGDAIVDSEEIGTDQAREATGEDQALASHASTHDAPVATPSFYHTPITAQRTPRDIVSPAYSINQSESEPLENVLVSYLLRHFKQDPGQWFV